ncbi:hypothetical protein [Nocardia sp. NPDC050175]|uniref:hypothetical protein n=1 Tax=Nocardia sp. NPDC050175 TaxID=3364317 RepID=UPI00379FACF1
MSGTLSEAGDKLTCFTAALATALVVRGEERWWRPLLAGGPTLSVSSVGDLLLFEHHAISPVRALGLRVNGSNDWATAFHAVDEQVTRQGYGIMLADTSNLPWQHGYRRWHAPHWITIIGRSNGWVIEDPLTMTTELGPQACQRIEVPSESELGEWSVSLQPDDTVLRLREEAVVGSKDIYAGRTYRWLEVGASAPLAPPRAGRLCGADAAITLACHFKTVDNAAVFLQVDDLWQALRQRELLLWAAGHDPALLDAPAFEHWESAMAYWRKIPPLLMRARMRAEAGAKVNTSLIVEILTKISEYEGKYLTSFPFAV